MKNSYLTRLGSVYNRTASRNKFEYIKYNFGSIVRECAGRKNASVLEIGPGMGEFIKFLHSSGIKDVDVIDSDENVLAFSKNKNKVANAYKSNNIISVKGKLRRYDLIIMIQVLEHMSPEIYPSVLETLYSVLKTNGFIIVVVPNANNPLGLTERYGDLQHYSAFTDQSLKDLIIYSGITNYEFSIKGYFIPPYSLVNVVRIILQKILHIFLLVLMIINGGTHFKTMTPNITLIIKKNEQA